MNYTSRKIRELLNNYQMIEQSFDITEDMIGIWDIDIKTGYLTEDERMFLNDWINCDGDAEKLAKIYQTKIDSMRKKKRRLSETLSFLLNEARK